MRPDPPLLPAKTTMPSAAGTFDASVCGSMIRATSIGFENSCGEGASSGTITTTSGPVAITADDDGVGGGTITYAAAVNHGSAGSTWTWAG